MRLKMKEIKAALESLIMQTFASVSTDKGILSWDGDEELPEVGARVYSLDEEGNEISVEDGEYRIEGDMVIVVEDGKVVEIRDEKVDAPEEPAEAPAEEPAEEPADAPAEEPVGEPDGEPIEGAAEEPKDEPAAEEPSEEQVDEKDARIAELEGIIAERDARIAELEARVAELEAKPAAEPAEEEFKRVNKIEVTGDKKLDTLSRIVNAKWQ